MSVALVDLSPSAAALLRSLAVATPEAPHVIALGGHDSPSRTSVAALTSHGLIANEPTRKAAGFWPTANGLAWIDLNPPELEHVAAPAPYLPGEQFAFLPGATRAEIDNLAVEAGTTFHQIVEALINRGLDFLKAHRKAPASTGEIVRRVGDFLVWSDLVRLIGHTNPTQLGRSLKLEFVPLARTSFPAGRGKGRPPSLGIHVSNLDAIEALYPIEVAAVRKEHGIGVPVTAPKTTNPRIVRAEELGHAPGPSGCAYCGAALEDAQAIPCAGPSAPSVKFDPPSSPIADAFAALPEPPTGYTHGHAVTADELEQTGGDPFPLEEDHSPGAVDAANLAPAHDTTPTEPA